MLDLPSTVAGNAFNRSNRGSNNRARNPRAGDRAGH